MSPPRSPAQHVAAEIRAEMARQRKSHADLMAVLDLSRPAWSRRIKGEIPFDANEIHEIAAFLGVPVTALLPEPVEAAS